MNGNHINIPHDITKSYGVPDSFALLKDRFIAVQYKKKKIIQIYELEQLTDQLNRDPDNMSVKSGIQSSVYFNIDQAISRNGKSFCVHQQYLALRNLKKKCFEVIDVELKKTVVSFAYEDIWYYNNYHILGSVFVFPHYMKVTFFDASANFA